MNNQQKTTPGPEPTTTLWTLFHSMLRHDGDADRARACCAWVADHLGELQRACHPSEAEVMIPVYEHWRQHREAPSFIVLQHFVSKLSNPELEERLKDYEDIRPALKALEVEDLPAILQTKTEEFQTSRLETFLDRAKIINRQGAKQKRAGVETAIKGPAAALAYLTTQVEREELTPAVEDQTGRVQMGDARTREIILAGAVPDPAKTMASGIPGLDSVMQLRAGTMVGLLGYAGAGKTRLGRSLLYNLAAQGRNVLHVQLETSEVDEVLTYALIHANQDQEWAQQARRYGISLHQLTRGLCSKEAVEWLSGPVLDDMQGNLGGIHILSPVTNRWDEIRDEIDRLHEQHKFGAVLVDYLSLTEMGSSRLKDDRVVEAIGDAARWAKRSGVLLVTPVQGRRDAAHKALHEQDGLWDLSGIHRYSDYDRHLDACIGVLQLEDKSLALSTPKNRRGPVLTSALKVQVDASGYVNSGTCGVSVDIDTYEFLEVIS